MIKFSEADLMFVGLADRVKWRNAYIGDLEGPSGCPGQSDSLEDGRDVEDDGEMIVLSEERGKPPFKVGAARDFFEMTSDHHHQAHWAPLVEAIEAIKDKACECGRGLGYRTHKLETEDPAFEANKALIAHAAERVRKGEKTVASGAYVVHELRNALVPACRLAERLTGSRAEFIATGIHRALEVADVVANALDVSASTEKRKERMREMESDEQSRKLWEGLAAR